MNITFVTANDESLTGPMAPCARSGNPNHGIVWGLKPLFGTAGRAEPPD